MSVGFNTVIAAATTGAGFGVPGICGGLISHAQELFDVSDEDVMKRLRAALMPFEAAAPYGGGAIVDFRARPDFWGPFWIATTAILFQAMAGNFARRHAWSSDQAFVSDYGLLSLAAYLIYGCLIGVPVLVRGALWVSGQEADRINFGQVICVYGYSLASIVPVSVLCVVNVHWLRWFFTLAGLLVALQFLRGNLWSDISLEAPSLKWSLVALLAGSEVLIFLVYRLRFVS